MTTTKHTKSVEISTWGYKGRVATVERDVSDANVRVRQDGEDTAQRAYGRRVARVAGRGLQLINSQLSHVEREGNVQAAVYELTFGYAVRGGGCEVAGSCWIKVYG